MRMAMAMAMDFDINLTKLLSAYLIVMMILGLPLGFARPCTSYQTPPAPALVGEAPLISQHHHHHLVSTQLLYTRLLDASGQSPVFSPSIADSPALSYSIDSPPPVHPSYDTSDSPAPSYTLDSPPPPYTSYDTNDSPPPPPMTPDNNNKFPTVPVAVSVVVATVLCFAVLFGWLLLKRKKRTKKFTDGRTPRSDAPLSGGVAAPDGHSRSDDSDSYDGPTDFFRKLPKRYSYHTLELATSNFNEKNKLGEGGFGPVFRGLFNDGKTEVAVKRVSKRATQAPKQYKAEVKILTRLSHRNLVELLGWCEEDGEFLLVYKYMPNGSLNSQLYSKSRLLSWDERYNIALGLASALNYLHEECEECILHRDIKPENVLLDSSFNAKLSDFGLARLVDHDIGVKNTTLAGTMGYMAPEHIVESRASKESDIYSFGVVLLEIACGRAPLARRDDDSGVSNKLIDVVWDYYGRKEILEMADKRLQGEYISEQVECVMMVGLWCAHPIYTERPAIGEAIKVLKFDAPSPELPPSRPELLPLLPDRRLQSERIRSSYTGNSSTGGRISRSSGYATQSSLVSSSISSSVATA